MHDVAKYGSVDNLLVEMASAYLSSGELELFRYMMESLQSANNDAAIEIFNSSSKDFNKANFQIGVVS